MVKRLASVSLLAVLAACLLARSAFAAAPAPDLAIHSFATPSSFSPGDNTTCEHSGEPLVCDAYQVTVTNTGSLPTDGSPITVTDTLPAGLTVKKITFFWSGFANLDLGEFACEEATVRCAFPFAALGPDETLTMTVYTTLSPSVAGTLTNTASVSGGGVPEASTSVRNPAGSTPLPFGVNAFSSLAAGLDGAPETQAGAHPYELTTKIDLNNEISPGTIALGESADESVPYVKDVMVDLPLGFLGSALATPRCTLAQLASEQGCPADTRVGQIRTEPRALVSVESPLYDMVPEHGVAAEFGYHDMVRGSHALYASVVPGAAGYVLRVTSPDVP